MTAIIFRLAILIAIFGSVFLISQVVLATSLNSRAQRRAVNKRLDLLRKGVDREQVANVLRRNFPVRIPDNAGPIDRILFRFQRVVGASGVSVGPGTIGLIMAIAFVIVTGLLLLMAWSSQVELTLGVFELALGVGIAAAVGLPLMYLSRRAQRRRKRMEEQFPLALDVFTRALRAGHPISAAIDLLTQEVEDPLGSEFGLVSDEVAYGAELNDALLGLAERWDLDDIRMFVISLSVQSETGGNLAEILENLTKVIRDRASLYMKVRALSSEGRMSAWMLTALPVLTFVSVVLVDPGFYFAVANDPIFIFGFSGLVVLYFIGVIVIRRMVDLKV